MQGVAITPGETELPRKRSLCRAEIQNFLERAWFARHPTSAAQRFTCIATSDGRALRQQADLHRSRSRQRVGTGSGGPAMSGEARGQGTGKFTQGRPRRGDGRRDEKPDFRGNITSGPAWRGGEGGGPGCRRSRLSLGGEKGTSCQVLWPLSRFLEKRSQAPFPLKSGKPGRASSPALTVPQPSEPRPAVSPAPG